MALRIGDEVPDFTAETTQGPIRFHEWIGSSWAILFSHPKDFTPVCTTELGYMARLKPEFDKRNTKIVGLSIDSVDDHTRWKKDIEETQGSAVTYPMIGDTDLKVAKLFDMIHPNTNRVFFSADPQVTYWRNRWMHPESYEQYRASLSHDVPLFSAQYTLRFKINGKLYQW